MQEAVETGLVQWHAQVQDMMDRLVAGQFPVEMGGSSDLEGMTVVFTWDEDDESYGVAFDEDSDGDDELLEGLEENMDLRAFLPEDDVAEGDTWGVDANLMRHVIAPGGALKILPDDLEGMGMGMGGSAPPNPGEFFEDFDGEITVKYLETREEDGARLAVLEISVDVSSAADMTDWMSEMIADAEMPEGMDVEIDVSALDMEFEFEGTG